MNQKHSWGPSLCQWRLSIALSNLDRVPALPPSSAPNATHHGAKQDAQFLLRRDRPIFLTEMLDCNQYRIGINKSVLNMVSPSWKGDTKLTQYSAVPTQSKIGPFSWMICLMFFMQVFSETRITKKYTQFWKIQASTVDVLYHSTKPGRILWWYSLR